MKNIKKFYEEYVDQAAWDGYYYMDIKQLPGYEDLIGLESLICDLAMYREDINNSPGRFQRVVDELIKMLDTPAVTESKLNHV